MTLDALLDALQLAIKAGQFDQALMLARRVAGLNPTDAGAWARVGVLCTQTGRHASAVEALQRSIALAPEEALPYFHLGLAFQDMGELTQAAEQYEQCLMRRPEDAPSWNNLGSCRQSLQDLAAAEHCFRQALEIDPRSVSALNNLALLLRQQGRRREARDCLSLALKTSPLHPTLWNNLGLISMDEGLVRDAQECFEQALARSPNDAEARCHLGEVQLQRNLVDAATCSFQEALRVSPTYALPRLQLGLVAAQTGDFSSAAEQYRQALAVDATCASAYLGLSRLPCCHWSPSERSDLERTAADTRLEPVSRAAACFALGNLLDREGQSAAAFEAFRTGHGMYPVEYDPAAHDQFVQQIIDVFQPALWERWQGVGDPTEQPVFVVGLPRSGTTLVEQILAAHPAVEPRGESSLLGELTHELARSARAPFPMLMHAAQASDLQQAAKMYLQTVAVTDKPRLVDKTPAHFLYLGLIAILFPKAYVIHCRRHPLDTLLSIYFCALPNLKYSRRLEHLGHYFQAYQRIMRHWRSVLPLHIHEVEYESLLTHQGAATEQLLSHLGLPWRDDCLAFHNRERRIDSSSCWQVRQPLYSTSVGRWRRYEEQLRPLREQLGFA